MELSNSFTVDVPVERAWEVLTDVPTIAPCLPGAQLQEVEGDEFRGVVKVKVGPITAQYKGAATFLERDDAAHRAVIKGQGRETRGQGNATAVITAQLRPAGEGTEVEVTTDLTVTGKVASLGRGAMAEVSAKLMDQFAENLRTTVLTDDADAPPSEQPVPVATSAPAEDASPVEATTPAENTVPADDTAPAEDAAPAPAAEPERQRVQTFDQPEPEAIDLLDAAGAPVLKRVVPAVLAGLVVLLLLRVLLRRRSRGTD